MPSAIVRTIATKIAKLPDLAGVSYPEVLAVADRALSELWGALAPSLDHNNATLDDLGVCEVCEEINTVAEHGELRLCSGCAADDSGPKAEPVPAPPPPGTLGVWYNGFDWVVASSAEDACDVACASAGEPREDYDASDWERCADDSTVTVRGDYARVTRTCAEWVVRHGRGFLCSTEA